MVVLKFFSRFFDYRHQFKLGEWIKGYTLLDKLGEGRFGMVYLGQDRHGQKVVIKQLKREMLLHQPHKVHFETDILKQLSVLNDRRFPKCIDIIKLKYRRGYILEYKEGQTIEEMIYKDYYIFSRKEIYTIAYQLLDIIQTLEKLNIVHKDIRVSNVIMHPDGYLTLIDFGLARYIDGKTYTKDIDYWYLGDFLIHLFYTSYNEVTPTDTPWYYELPLLDDELILLKKLMAVDTINYPIFNNIDEIYTQLNHITLNK